MSEKLQKVLARAGVGSRREMERWIEQGRVSVGGKIATLGDRVTGEEQIRADGKLISVKPEAALKTRVIAYHKPVGEICSLKDPEGRKTVFDNLPNIRDGRWISIGRLDINTSGLLLFTNNGELANRLMHPSYQIERRYASRVNGQVTAEMLRNLKNGVELDGDMCHFTQIRDCGGEGSNHWYEVTLLEGKNREVRRLWESQNVAVARLTRIAYGPFGLPRSLSRGRWQELEGNEVKRLADEVKLDVNTHAARSKSQPKKKVPGKARNPWKR